MNRLRGIDPDDPHADRLTLELDLQRQVSLRAIGHHLGHRHDGKGPHISPPPCLGINAIPPTPGLESISSSHVG